MAYSAPRTFVAGEIETAAIFNTYLRDNDLWVLTDSPCANAYRSATQSIPNTTDTLVQLNNELFDNANLHDNVTNNNSFTIPTGGGGKYLITVNYDGASAGAGGWLGSVAHNSRTAFTNKVFYAGSAGANHSNGTGVATLAAADYIACMAYQGSGGAANIGGVVDMEGTRTPVMSAFWFRT